MTGRGGCAGRSLGERIWSASRTRLKNQVHATPARNLPPSCPVSDLFGKAGRRWLAEQPLPSDERRSVEALLRQLDFHGMSSSSSRPISPARRSPTRSLPSS
jgi:hypothetical protein